MLEAESAYQHTEELAAAHTRRARTGKAVGFQLFTVTLFFHHM